MYLPQALACQISIGVLRTRPAVFVQHPAAHNDPFADRLAGVLFGQVGRWSGSAELCAEIGTGHFGKSMREPDQRLRRSAFHGTDIGRMQILGLRAGVRPAIRRDPQTCDARSES